MLQWTATNILMRSKQGKNASDAVQAIHNLVMYSFIRGDYDSVQLGVSTLLSTVSEVSRTVTNSVFTDMTYREKWLLLSGSHISSFTKQIKGPEATMVEALCKLVHICVVPRDDPYIPMIALSRMNNWGIERVSTARDPIDWQAMDKFVISLAAIALLAGERKCADTVWWVLDFYKSLSSTTNRPPVPQQLYSTFCIDSITGIVLTLASVKLHLPGFTEAAKSTLHGLATRFTGESFEEGNHQASEFIRDVFPDLEPYRDLRNCFWALE